MTQEAVLDFGFEIMKRYAWPHMFLFLADNGWEGGYELVCQRVDDGHVSVSIKHWDTVVIPQYLSPN